MNEIGLIRDTDYKLVRQPPTGQTALNIYRATWVEYFFHHHNQSYLNIANTKCVHPWLVYSRIIDVLR